MFLQQDYQAKFGCVCAADGGEEGRDGERCAWNCAWVSQIAKENEEKSNNLKGDLLIFVYFWEEAMLFERRGNAIWIPSEQVMYLHCSL